MASHETIREATERAKDALVHMARAEDAAEFGGEGAAADEEKALAEAIGLLHSAIARLRQTPEPRQTPKSLTDPIEAIAQKHLDIETLETRNSDSLDFHEVAVWQLREALQAAYLNGQRAGRLEAGWEAARESK